ncbi:MAG: transcriptional regulator [Vulcanimicrobiota bacterium]
MSDETNGRFSYDGLDRVLHEKARLSILTSLLTHPEGLLFGDIKSMCSLTDGNLSRHLQLLYKEGLIEMWKGFENRRPQTLCRISEEGRNRFLEYLAELEKVLSDASAQQQEPETGTGNIPPGWVPA